MSEAGNDGGRGWRAPNWLGLVVAVAVPSITGLIAAGQLMSEIRSMREDIVILRADRGRIDGRAATIENAVARLEERFAGFPGQDIVRLRTAEQSISRLEAAIAGARAEMQAVLEGHKQRLDGLATILGREIQEGQTSSDRYIRPHAR